MCCPITPVHDITFIGYICKADNITNDINVYRKFNYFGRTKKIERESWQILCIGKILAIFIIIFTIFINF